jgi:hypothetical protein
MPLPVLRGHDIVTNDRNLVALIMVLIGVLTGRCRMTDIEGRSCLFGARGGH